MHLKQTGAPAGAPNVAGAEFRTDHRPNYTPNPGARQIARLIAGEHLEDPLALAEPWRAFALAIQTRRNGHSAIDVFEELITLRPDADDLRSAVLAVRLDTTHAVAPDEAGLDTTDLSGPNLDLLAAAPELPLSARIPKHLETGLENTGVWLSQYIAFAGQASPMSPPLFHLSLGLTLLSTAIARRVCLRVSNYNLYPNIYTLIVAHSTLYAKTTAFEIARRVLELADLSRLMLPVGITPQSLVSELTSRQPDTFASWELSDQDDWRQERPFAAQRVWLMDEAAGLLEAFDQKHLADLLNQVLKLYDCPDKLTAASTIARGRQTIRNAYLTICGPTTPSAMRAHLGNRSHWGNGLFARFAFVTPDVPPQRIFYPAEIAIPASLTEPLRRLALQRLPMPREAAANEIQSAEALPAQLEHGVWELWDAYHGGLWEMIRTQAIPEKFYASYGRLHTLAMKIALQLATADWAGSSTAQTVTVSLQHWAKAQLITEELRSSLHRMLADAGRVSEDDDLEAKVIRLLRQAARGLSTRELAIALSMTESTRRDQLDRLVERMRRDGLVELIERKSQRGPAAQAWVLLSKSGTSPER